MATKLTDYLSTPDQLDTDTIISTRQRLQTFINQFWPELDTRPNSVFGDLHLTPLATLVAGIEDAQSKLMSDLDLSNVARGIIFNSTFITAYLKGLGISSRNAVAASGTVKLVFTADLDYTFDLDASFTFGSQVFKINAQEGNPVLINSTNVQSGRRVLTKVADQQYVVFMPVTGPAGSTITDGDSATTTLTITQLSSVVAVGDFDSGLLPDTLPQMAIKAQRSFASANLTSRSGIVSFMNLRFPSIMGASATITGDPEMVRPGRNPLGLLEGAIDVFVKSQPTFLSDSSIVTLVYDYIKQAWVGQLTLPVIPAFMDLQAGIFQVGNFLNSRGVNQIFAQSTHPYIDNAGVSYSRYERLGLQILDPSPTNFEPSFLGGVTTVVSDGTTLQVQGEYASSVFNAKPDRNITMRIDSVTTLNSLPALRVNLRDNLTAEVGTVYFIPNAVTSPTSAIMSTTAGDYSRMVNGLTMTLTPASGPLVLSAMVGFTYEFSFRGRTSNFTVNYLYDPVVTRADSIVQDPDNKPVNVSVLTRSFLVCYISDFVVNYRIPFGAQVDQDSARQAIADYVNGIVFPDVYEESKIGQILNIFGGASLMSISKRGSFYPSIASNYVDRNNVTTAITRLPTNTLMPPVNSAGVGPRNVTYLLDPSLITFNATIR